jgi:P27 family predicted phage terminase small subunit
MARPGPTGKPVELKALEGNRGHRPLNLDATFRPEVGMPTVPASLSPSARKAWKRLAPELLRYNLMSAVYSDTFEDLCETIADVKLLRRSIRARQALLRDQEGDEAEAFIVKTPNGMPVQSPVFQILRALRADMLRLLDKFGLSPAEQASVTTAVRAQLKLFENDNLAGTPPAAPGAEPRGFADF